jgi:hypothetical protein
MMKTMTRFKNNGDCDNDNNGVDRFDTQGSHPSGSPWGC